MCDYDRSADFYCSKCSSDENILRNRRLVSAIKRCVHVSRDPYQCIQRSGNFVDMFVAAYYTYFDGGPNRRDFNENVAKKAMMSTMNKFPSTRVDETERKLITDTFVEIGVDTLLGEGDLEHAKLVALAISFLEDYIKQPHDHSQGKLKYRDAVDGCMRSLFKFYIQRTSCSCLDEKYLQLKTEEPKTGICDGCGKRSERSNLFACSRCYEVQYCDRKCQLAHWPLHQCCG